MTYLVKALSVQTHAKRTDEQPKTNNWASGSVDLVDDALIQHYLNNPTLFTVLGRSGYAPDGLVSLPGLTAVDTFTRTQHTTVFTLSDLVQSVVNGTEYVGTKLFDFPLGKIEVYSCVASLQQKTISNLTGTINASSTGAVSLGTATASATTLATTMADLAPSTAFVSSATVNTAGTAVTPTLAAGAQFDGSSTAIDMYLNSAFATTTDVDGDAKQTWSGTITIVWANLSDM